MAPVIPHVPPHPFYAPPDSAYIPATSIHWTRRSSSPSSPPFSIGFISRLRRARNTRRPTRSLSYGSNPSEHGGDDLRQARHGHRVARSRSPSRRGRVPRRDPRTEQIEDIYGSHGDPKSRAFTSKLPSPPTQTPTQTHRTRSRHMRSTTRPYTPRPPTYTHRSLILPGMSLRNLFDHILIPSIQ